MMQFDLSLDVSPHHGDVLNGGFLKDVEMLKVTWEPTS